MEMACACCCSRLLGVSCGGCAASQAASSRSSRTSCVMPLEATCTTRMHLTARECCLELPQNLHHFAVDTWTKGSYLPCNTVVECAVHHKRYRCHPGSKLVLAEVPLRQTASLVRHSALLRHSVVQQGISGKHNKAMMHLHVRNGPPSASPPQSCLTRLQSYKGLGYWPVHQGWPSPPSAPPAAAPSCWSADAAGACQSLLRIMNVAGH